MNRANLWIAATLGAMAASFAAMVVMLALLLTSTVVHAQTTPPPVFTVPDSVPQPLALPSCWPERIGGAGKGFVSGQFEGPEGGSVTKGQYVGWWCELPGAPRGQWRMAAIWGGLNYAVIHPDYPAGATMAQIASAYWTANVKTMPEPPVEQWHINMNAAIVTDLSRTRPVTPPAEAWLTVGRSTYNTVGGKLTTFTGLTTLGLACNCASPIVVGTVTYCPFAGAAPSVVASCRKNQ